MEQKLQNLRLDELPLLHHDIRELGIKEAIDGVLCEHGNWSGISIGRIIAFWLCYILSECDHRLHNVEDWSEKRLDLLRVLGEDNSVSCYDFTDDKLGLVLEKIGLSDNWTKIAQKINENSVCVYRLGSESDVSTFRLQVMTRNIFCIKLLPKPSKSLKNLAVKINLIYPEFCLIFQKCSILLSHKLLLAKSFMLETRNAISEPFSLLK